MNAPEIFQPAMGVILPPVKWQYALVNLDNLIVFSRSPGERIEQKCQVLILLRNTGVILKMKKCEFFISTIHLVGHVIQARRTEISSQTTDAFQKMNRLTNITRLLSYIAYSGGSFQTLYA